jgi:hypothetical protein
MIDELGLMHPYKLSGISAPVERSLAPGEEIMFLTFPLVWEIEGSGRYQE